MKSKYIKLGLGCVIVVAIVMTCVCSRLAVVYEASSGFRYELQNRLKSGGAAEQGDIYVDVLEDRLQKWRSDHVKDLVIEFFRHRYPSLSVPEQELRQEVELAQIGLGKKGLCVFQIVVRARWPEVCAGLANAYVEAISAYTDEENRMRNDRAVAQIHSAVEHSQRIVERIGRKLSKFEGSADVATSKAALEAQWAKEMAYLNEWRQKEAKYRKLSEDNNMAVEFAWRAVVSKLLVWRGVQWHACLPQDKVCSHLRCKELDKGLVKRYAKPTTGELQSYVGLSEEITLAYSNGQASVMQECANRFPKEAYRLRGDDLVRIIQPISRLWMHECGRTDRHCDFATPREFEHQMEMRLALTKIYGNFIVESGENAVSELGTLDITILKQLQECRNRYAREGKDEYLTVAESLVTEWIEQIESERGFTREYARSQKEGLWHLVERGEVTEEELMANVRIYPLMLKEHCGYTPKWLDAEFPAAPDVRVEE